jgi:hypothetical protein
LRRSEDTSLFFDVFFEVVKVEQSEAKERKLAIKDAGME